VSTSQTPYQCPALGTCLFCSQCASGCCSCAKGNYCPGNDQQIPCPAGTHNNMTRSYNATSCAPCPIDTYSSTAGATSCTACPAGSRTTVGATSCSQCPRNTYAAASGVCVPCPFGTTAAVGSSVCSQTIVTIGGSGVSGSSADGSFATTAAMLPMSVVTDRSGNIYFVDGVTRVRKFNKKTGQLSTFAGNRTAGYNGDGIQATRAFLSFPRGLAFDTGGNMYIADVGNNNIRKVSTAGIIVSVAGGSKCGSTAICLGCACTSGTVSRGYAGFAGDGSSATSAWLNGPYGMAVDVSGNLFIADTSNQRIRFVSATTKLITSIAGAGSYQYSTSANCPFFPKSPTNNLYCPAQKAPSGSTTFKATYSGYCCDGYAATSAWLNFPSSVALDARGNLYITESSNNRLRKVTATSSAGGGRVYGNISTIAAGLNGPMAVSVDVKGNVYFADTFNYRIKVYNTTSGVVSNFAGNGASSFYGDGGPSSLAGISSVYGISIDASGNMYIADLGNFRIRQLLGNVFVINTLVYFWFINLVIQRILMYIRRIASLSYSYRNSSCHRCDYNDRRRQRKRLRWRLLSG
jgi:sugar lactone lactonase YvrE